MGNIDEVKQILEDAGVSEDDYQEFSTLTLDIDVEGAYSWRNDVEGEYLWSHENLMNHIEKKWGDRIYDITSTEDGDNNATIDIVFNRPVEQTVVEGELNKFESELLFPNIATMDR